MYTSYKGDEKLKEVILGIYNFIQSTPFPKKWLKEKVELFNIEKTSFEKTPWGEILINKAKDELKDAILRLSKELENVKSEDDTEKFIVTLSEDIRKIKLIYETKTWDDMYTGITNLKLDKLPVDKRVPPEIKDKIKELRGKIRKDLANINEKILQCSSEEALKDISIMYDILVEIEKLTIKFAENFAKVKQERNIMDFSDVEHFALEILKNESEEDNHVCKKYREKYEEILIDEYQDSNLVQETILNSISKGNNIFMVGDVKQSIYKFRQARPELFLEKYENYKEKQSLQDGKNLKIQLFKNFRSRKNILDITNIIFDNIMTKKLGDIDYTKEEFLNLGAEYPKTNKLKTELHIIDLKEDEESIYKEDDSEDEIIDEKVEDIVLEAKLVAKKIKELLDSGFVVCNKDKTTRKITYKDIAILLRSTKTLAPIYEQEISKLNLPVFCDTTSRIFRFSGNRNNDEFT